MDNSELFRNAFISQLDLPPDQMVAVLHAFDAASSNYEISRKQLDIIPTNGIPEVVKWFLASKSIENIGRKTIDQYKYKLFNFFSAVRKPFQDVTANDVRLYLHGYKTTHGVSDRTVEHTRVILNTFFDWCVTNEYLIRNPVAKIERVRFQPKERKPLTAYELELIRWNCEEIREKALVDFLFSTGCRISECADVRLSDINWQDRSVLIRHGKGNKSRVVFFNAESELTLKEYLKTRSDGNDGLFVSERAPHQQLKPHALENIVSAVSNRCGLHVYPHKLRHTFATSGLRGGMPITTLQSLMGHVNPQTTMIYAKLNADDLQREHQRIYA